jgi:hypothetical protein
MEKSYQEFNVLPAWTKPVWKGEEVANDSDEFKWSGDKSPPELGAKVKTGMNNLGTGTVVKYFAEHGWLGVLVKLERPPKWYTEQNKGNPPAHLFGIDLNPPRKINVKR